MAKIKRIYCKGHPYFITNITYKRRPFLLDYVDLLWEAVKAINGKVDFDLMAWAILPDHFHFLIDVKNANISKLLQQIKLSFSVRFRKIHGFDYGMVWQNGFWDHIIRDQKDLNNHLDYIHYNPVKHGLTYSPFEFRHSSIQQYKDYYQEDWGVVESLEFDGNFGE